MFWHLQKSVYKRLPGVPSVYGTEKLRLKVNGSRTRKGMKIKAPQRDVEPKRKTNFNSITLKYLQAPTWYEEIK